MSDCRQTDAIELRLARGEELRPAEAVHARTCTACATSVAAAARLATDLPRAVARLISEPMPPAQQLLAVRERRAAWRGVKLVAALATAGAAAALAGVVIMAGQFIGLTGPAPGGGRASSAPPSGTQPIGSVPDDLAGWVAEADASIWAHMDRPLPAPELALVRLERCGDTALAFFADPAPSGVGPLLFGLGDYRQPPFEAGFGGVASSVDEPEAAYARSQRDRPCEVVYDTVISHEQALDAYVAFLHGDDRVTNPRVLATKMVTADVALAYVDEVQAEDGQPHQQVLVLRRAGDTWAVTGAQGGDLPVVGRAVGVTPLGVDKDMPDLRWAAVGRIADERVVAVELDFEGFAHRYPVSGGAFLIQLPGDVGFELPYRLLDAAGRVVSEGASQP